MTDYELDDLEALADKATPGPWSALGLADLIHTAMKYYDFADVKDDEWMPDHEDASFIAAARTAVPALIAEVRRLRKALEDRT